MSTVIALPAFEPDRLRGTRAYSAACETAGWQGAAPSARLRRLSGRAEHRGCTRGVLGILELQPLPLVVSTERIVIGSGLGALDRAPLLCWHER
jgi:hypothetical protein